MKKIAKVLDLVDFVIMILAVIGITVSAIYSLFNSEADFLVVAGICSVLTCILVLFGLAYYYLHLYAKDTEDENEKHDKALEIIIIKVVDIQWLMKCENASTYNRGVGSMQRLKRTEFKLLKEVVKENG